MSKFEILQQLQAGNVQAVIAKLEAEERQYERYLQEEEEAFLLAQAAAEDAVLVL